MKTGKRLIENLPSTVHHKILSVDGQPIDPKDSLAAWMQFYLQVQVMGGSEHTQLAKQNDLQRFLLFFTHQVGTERVDYWTPSMTKAFQKYLQNTPRKELIAGEKKEMRQRKGEDNPLLATSINRNLATLRHFARWLHAQRPFPTGNPFEGVKDIGTEDPAWNGLKPREQNRLRIACEQRMAFCTRADQNALLETAVFYCLLYTGLRESELAALNIEQYHHRGFHNVKRKGKKVTNKIPLPVDAKEWLDKYLQDRVGATSVSELNGQAPLFVTRNGNRIQRWDIYRISQRICDQANASGEGIRLTPHMLRHTFLKRVADKHGIHVAQEMSGNISMKEVFRYTKPSQEEKDQLAESVF